MIIIEHRRTRAKPVGHFHRQCLSELDRLMRKEHQSSQLRRHFLRSDTPHQHQVCQWIEA
jgi:hypothetical protein